MNPTLLTALLGVPLAALTNFQRLETVRLNQFHEYHRFRGQVLTVVPAFFLLILTGLAGWQLSLAPAFAADAQTNGNDLLWSIGTTDNSGDEFGSGSVASLVYDVSPAADPKQWREKQEVGQQYCVRFSLPQVPAAPMTLVIEGFFMEPGPRALLLNLNGTRGAFRLVPVYAKDLDFRQGWELTHTRAALRIPIAPAWLRQGINDAVISVTGEGGGNYYYDSLRLEKSGDTFSQELEAVVEPTIFFRRAAEGLNEVTEVVIRHQRPLKDGSVSLKVGNTTATAKFGSDGVDFGESIIELDVNAPSAPQPYELTVTTGDEKKVFRGEYRPEKRWKFFAGLKVHNDIGYTDLQQSVEELECRNTDRALDFIARYPFYKFNLEHAWLAENYLQLRQAPSVKELMDRAARDQIGIGALYLNMPCGLASAEEMYRALYFSTSLRRIYGVPMTTASQTDMPSQPWSLPSLLADAGITGFALGANQHRGPMLIKSTLNEDSPFYWEGPDGRRVITFFARSYEQLDRMSGQRTFPGKGSVERLRRGMSQALTRYRRPEYVPDALYLFGQSGDNADLKEDRIQLIKDWNAVYEYPKLIPATDADYFDYVSKHFATNLPVIRGDGGSYWADAAGSSTAFTTLNRDTQRLLPVAETISAWASLLDPAGGYPAEALRKAWSEVLFYDEHTWGAAPSVSQPDRSVVTTQFEFKQAHAVRAHWAAKDVLQHAMTRLGYYINVDHPVFLAFNPDFRPRTDLVETELDANQQIFDLATGQPVPVDVVVEKQGWRRVRFQAEQVPGLGYKAYEVRTAKLTAPASGESQMNSWEIESRYYRVTLDPKTGAVVHVLDKEANRDLVDQNASFKLNELVYSAGGENQQISRNIYTNQPTKLEVTGQSDARLIENVRTPFGQRIRIAAKAKNVPLVESEITVYDNLKRIDIQNHIRKEDIRAKEAIYFAFPFAVTPPELQYQVHNSWVRPNEDQLPGACREWFTTPNLVLARDPGLTIAFATPDIPLVTLTDINRGLWPDHLDIKNGHVYSYVTVNYWVTNIKASQGGDLTFRYFITSANTLDFDALGQFDAQTRSPLIGYNFADWGNRHTEPGAKRLPANAGALFQIEAGNAQVTTFKAAEDSHGYILRLRETSGRDGTAHLVSPLFPIARAYLASGVEENFRPLPLALGGLDIPLQSRRFSTVRLEFADSASMRPIAKQDVQ